MPQVMIDPMDNAGNWKALAPDGVTLSAEFSMTNDLVHYRFGSDKTSGKISATSNALNHTLQRPLPNLDLTNFDDIRFWLSADRPASGTPERPFYLEIRLASAALGLSNAGNTWRRFLPVQNTDNWDLVRLHLDDVPGAIRNSVNLIQLRVADASAPFTCFLDDVLAVKEEMIGDVDAGLLALLDKNFSSNGTLVPAVITLPENPPAIGIPSIRISQYDLQYARERTNFNQLRGDYTAGGFRLSPVSISYDVYYFIDVYGDTRSQKTQIVEFVLRTLSPRCELIITGTQQLLEWVTVEPLDDTGKWRSDRELLYFKVAVRQEIGIFEPVVPPYANISLVTDQQARP